jgi:hypothetical protein
VITHPLIATTATGDTVRGVSPPGYPARRALQLSAHQPRDALSETELVSLLNGRGRAVGAQLLVLAKLPRRPVSMDSIVPISAAAGRVAGALCVC